LSQADFKKSSIVQTATPNTSHPSQARALETRVPATQKAAYGIGSLGDFFLANVLQGLASPIYVIAMKLDPGILGMIMAAARVLGAACDPIIGNISDNTHSRWGRRKPYILAGAVIGAIAVPLLWTVPRGGLLIQAAYIMFIVAILMVACSLFSVPYGAVGLELTDNYDDRTRVFAWRNYVQTAGVFSGSWFYWFCLLPGFGNEVVGARWLSVIASVIILGAAATALIVVRPRIKAAVAGAKGVSLGKALRVTFSNRPFLLIQFAGLAVAFGTGIDGPIGMYLHLYYACAGNKTLASIVGGSGGTLCTLAIFVATPLGLWLSTKFGKRESAMCGMSIMLLAVFSIPFTMNPHHPYLVVVTWILSTIGMQIVGLMTASMIGDICDEDELATGLRREGSYVSVGSLLGKTCQVAVLLVGGWLPHAAGYLDLSAPPSPVLLERMKWILIGTQLAGVGISLYLLWLYPLNRARALEIRALIEARRANAEDKTQGRACPDLESLR
jgi:GPH family glycoside/pentoside/hexuronide:cation symporter